MFLGFLDLFGQLALLQAFWIMYKMPWPQGLVTSWPRAPTKQGSEASETSETRETTRRSEAIWEPRALGDKNDNTKESMCAIIINNRMLMYIYIYIYTACIVNTYAFCVYRTHYRPVQHPFHPFHIFQVISSHGLQEALNSGGKAVKLGNKLQSWYLWVPLVPCGHVILPKRPQEPQEAPAKSPNIPNCGKEIGRQCNQNYAATTGTIGHRP